MFASDFNRLGGLNERELMKLRSANRNEWNCIIIYRSVQCRPTGPRYNRLSVTVQCTVKLSKFSGNCMYNLLQQSVILHFVHRGYLLVATLFSL